MKFETSLQGSTAVLRLSGRLDASWVTPVHAAVSDLIRDGCHCLRIDASGLDYLSSAGLRVLLRIRRDLAAVNGSLGIIRPSAFVRDTLQMSGLDALVVAELETDSPDAAPAAAQAIAGMTLEGHTLDAVGGITLQAQTNWTPWQVVRADAWRDTALPRSHFGLGIGAAGHNAADARDRLGDFVAAAGCVAWLPSDGAEAPDFLEQAERFVPRLQTIQALVGEGVFSHLLRFQPATPGTGAPLSALLEQAMAATASDAVAAVLLAETEGLVGASLARSPGLIREGDRPGEFPAIRDWLAFCGERLHRRTQALVVAFACRERVVGSLPALASTPARAGLHLHAHAVAWPFRPFPQGVVDLEAAVRAVTDESAPLGLLHLLMDDRPAIGLGESAFLRGACWCAPLRRGMEVPV